MEPAEEPKPFDELDKLADSGKLDLQKELAKYRKAYQEEFEESQKIAPDDAEQHTQDFFRKNLPELVAQVVWLAHNAESDAVRLSACKFGINEALKDSRAEGDPIKNLLKELGEKKAVGTG
jgi:hypothetical protein